MRKKSPSAEDMRRAEAEIGKNIPDEMVGLDSGDVRDVGHARAKEKADDAAAQKDAG